MSLGIIVKGSEGVVLAADSRLTLLAAIAPSANSPGLPPGMPQQLFVNFDNATKLLTFAEPNNWIGAVTYGDAVIGKTGNDLRTAQSFIPEFEAGLPTKDRMKVEEFAKELSKFFMEQWQNRAMPAAEVYQGQGMTFAIGGYDPGKPYATVYLFSIPKQPDPQEQAPNDFGITFGGQAEHTIRLLQGYDPRVLGLVKQIGNLSDQQMTAISNSLAPLRLAIPTGILPLQDCIDLAIFLIHTTIAAQKLSMGIRGVGGAIDVAVITRRDYLRFVQRKELVGDIGVKQKGEALP
jgi:hypothetical protein